MRTRDPELMKNIKDYIEQYYAEHRTTPSTQNIGDRFGVTKVTIYKYLLDMDKRGLLSYKDGVLSTDKIGKLTPQVNYAPIVGSIPCGTPEECEEQIEEYFPLPVSVFGSGDFYVLRASGDSMIDAGIQSGDFVIIEKQNTAKEGDIVVALTDENESTLKRLCLDKEHKCYYLHPENNNYEDIYVYKMEIQGVARNIIKKI